MLALQLSGAFWLGGFLRSEKQCDKIWLVGVVL